MTFYEKAGLVCSAVKKLHAFLQIPDIFAILFHSILELKHFLAKIF